MNKVLSDKARNSESQRIDTSSLIFNLCILSSATAAWSTLCQGRLNPYLHLYIYINIYTSTNDFHPFHQTKLHSTKPPPRTKKHLTKADTNTPSTTNPPRLQNAKTDSEATSSGTTLHSARTSAPISDTNSSA